MSTTGGTPEQVGRADGAAALVHDAAAAGLILLAFALIATEHLVHYPVGLMAVLGLVRMLRASTARGVTHHRTLLVLFACIWVPMLAALVGAADFEHSAKKTFAYLHLLPATWFVVDACATARVRRFVAHGVVALLVFTGLDAFAQLIWKVDLFGYPYDGRILMGVFHPKQRLGLVLAALAPLYIEVVRHWCRDFPRLWLLHVPMAIVMLMTLKRSAWLMLLAGLAGHALLTHGWSRLRRPGLRPWQVLLTALIVAGAVTFNPTLRNHLTNSVGLFSADFEQFDRASSYRLTLWRTGFDMFSDNWLNGVGPRGYRHAYLDYAADDDFWVERSGSGQTHPHLLLLEVAVETGLLGLIGLAAFYILVARRLLAGRAEDGAPWLLCCLVAWLPFNAHLAFYGSYWSTLSWLLLAIGLRGTRLSPVSAAARAAP